MSSERTLSPSPALRTDAPSALDRTAILGLLLVCGLALLLRWHRLDAESLWMDEVRQVSYYSLPLKYLVLEGCGQGQPPLDYLIGGALDRLSLADSDWWVRFPAMFFGVGGVFLLGWLVMRITGAIAGISAALLLAVCPLHIEMSQEARPYTVFFFFAMAAILTFHRAYRKNTFGAWICFGAAYFCMLLTRTISPHVVSLGFAMFAIFSWIMRRRSAYDTAEKQNETRRLWAAATSMAVAYACVNPLLGILYAKMQGFVNTPQITSWPAQIGGMIASATQTIIGYHATPANADLAIAPAPLLVLAGQITLLFTAAIGVLLLIARTWRDRRPASVLFVATLLMFPVAYAMIYTKATTFPAKPQYLLLMAAPLFGCAAIAIDGMRLRLARRSQILSWTTYTILLVGLCVPLGQGLYRCLVHAGQAQLARHIHIPARPCRAERRRGLRLSTLVGRQQRQGHDRYEAILPRGCEHPPG